LIGRILESVAEAFVLFDRDYRITYINGAAKRIAGPQGSQLLGRTLWEAWPGARDSEIAWRCQIAIETGKAQHFDFRYVEQDISRWLELHAYPGEDGIAVSFRDVTAHKLEQSRLQRIERAYRAALSNTPDLVFVFGVDHRFIYANEALLALCGWTAEEAIGQTCRELEYPQWRAGWPEREIDQAVATRAPVRCEGPVDRLHETRTYEHIFVPVLGPDGEVEAVAGTSRDITERNLAEQSLRASEERLRLAQSAGGLATWDWDLETGKMSWTPGSAWVCGRPPEELDNIDRCMATVHEEDREGFRAAIQRTIEGAKEAIREFRVVWPDGSIHWLEGRAAVVRAPDGRAIRFLGLNSDITLRKQSEEDRHNQRLRLARLLEQAPAFVALFNGPEHVYEFVNPLYRELIGNRDVVGKRVREVEDPGVVERLDRAYRTGQPFTAHALPVDFVRIPGHPPERRFLNMILQPLREADGLVSGVILLGVDITEPKKAEEALLRTEKLAVVGRMAASISHEINNPLAAVTNLLYLIQGDKTLGPETRTYLDVAQSELARISYISTQTLSFFRQSTNPVRIEIKAILDSVAALYERRLAAAEVTLEREYSTSEPVLIFDGELRQIVANLFANSLDAIGARGLIVLRERRGTDWPSGRKGILVTVADTGHGMSPETMQRIFDPFFSTKHDTGTGLGLWVTKQMVEKRGGKIRVRSCPQEPHRGSVFSIFLPELECLSIEPAVAEL
jgi:PAS domain S-box-containing protein